jgi:PAS domain S-box-containing protein
MISLLLVDDEPDLLEVGKIFLERSGEISVKTCKSAFEALEILSYESFDAIVSDYQMPGMDGIQLLQKVRLQYPRLPFIIFTGRGRETVVIDALEHGADFYVQKGGDPKPQFAELSHKIIKAVEKREDERKITYLTRLYTVLSSINQIVMRIRDPSILFEEACKKAVHDGGFALAWIGLPDENGTLIPAAKSGMLEDSIETVRIKKDVPPENQHPAAAVFLNGSFNVINDLELFPVSFPGRDSGIKAGFRSIGAFPLTTGGRVIGSYTFCSTRKDFFYGEELSLLEELAEDVSFALELFEKEKMRMKAEVALHESEEKYRNIFSTAKDAILILENYRITDCNPAAEQMFGHGKEKIQGKSVLDYSPHFQSDRLSSAEKVISFSNTRQTGDSHLFEWRFLREDGSEFDSEISITPIFSENKNRLLTIVRDVSERKKNQLELDENKRQLETLMNNLPGIVYRCRNDPSWTMEFMSDGVYDLLGFAPEDLVESRTVIYGDLIHPDDRKQVWDDVQLALLGKSPYLLEFRIARSDGSYRWVWEQGRGVFDEKGELIALEGFITDITDLKRTLEEIESAREEMREIIEFLPDATFVIDREHRVIAWNRAMEEMTGISEESIMGKGDYCYAIPFYGRKRPILIDLLFDYNGEIAATYDSIKKVGDKLVGEVFAPGIYGGRGGDLWFTASPLFDSEGKIYRAIESIRDVSFRKEAEQELRRKNEELAAANSRMKTLGSELHHKILALSKEETRLRESETRFRLLFDNSPVAMAISGYSGTVELLNEKFLNTIGYTLQDIPTISDWWPRAYPDQVYRSEQMRRWNNSVESALQNHEEIRSQEARVTCKDGSEKILEIFGTPIGDKLLVIFSDVTERKETEDALKIALKNLNLLQSVTRHDILNQLTILLGFLSVTKTYQVCEEVGLYVDRSIKAAENIRQQILFTRDYQDIGRSVPAWQNLGNVIRNAAYLFEPAKINLNPGVSEIILYADPLLEKVFYNLFDNSVRHGNSSPEISVAVKEKGGVLIITVTDNGAGIPASEKQHIFDRGVGKNTGLGLFLSREILSITGLDIRETGTEGKGARFEIIIPAGLYRIQPKA